MLLYTDMNERVASPNLEHALRSFKVGLVLSFPFGGWTLLCRNVEAFNKCLGPLTPTIKVTRALTF